MKKVISWSIIITVCLAIIISIATCSSTGSGSHSYSCKVCHRTFNGGTADSRKIISSGMCVQCYKNYKYVTG